MLYAYLCIYFESKSLMKAILRITDESDLEDVLKLQKKTFREVAKLIGNDDLLPLHQTLSQIQGEFEQGVILKYVNEDNCIIGSVRGYIDSCNICHIGKLIVDPNFQNQGVGKALMAEIESQFSLCLKFTLFTGEETPNTLYLYSKMGYQVTEKKILNGINMIIMEKMNIYK